MNIEAPAPSASNGIPLHTLTFFEALDARKAVYSSSGYLVGGPDRRGANALTPASLWRMWLADVGARIETVPEKVRDFFLRTHKLAAPPKPTMDVKIYGSADPLPFVNEAAPVVDPQTGYTPDEFNETTRLISQALDSTRKLANPPRFATSFSGMQSFLQCPFKWSAEKYFKTVPYEESAAAKWGNRVHATAENYLKKHTHQPHGLIEEDCLPLVQKYCDLFISSGAEVHPEKEMCFTKDLKPCGWKDWNTVWFRGKADVITIKNRKLNVYDFKTGKVKDDVFQLEVMIACASLHFGDLFDEANGKLIFLKESDPKKALVGLPVPVAKADIPAIWERIFSITNRMEQAWQTENFRKQTNGLCKNYCGAMDCVHNGRRGR